MVIMRGECCWLARARGRGWAGERNCCAGSRKAAQKETAAGKDCRFLKYVYIYFFVIFYTLWYSEAWKKSFWIKWLCGEIFRACVFPGGWISSNYDHYKCDLVKNNFVIRLSSFQAEMRTKFSTRTEIMFHSKIYSTIIKLRHIVRLRIISDFK